MKNVFFFILLFWTSVIYISCTKGNAQPNSHTDGKTAELAVSAEVINDNATKAILTNTQGSTLGNITVTNDAYFIYVTYQATPGYVLTQTKLYIGANYLLPVAKNGDVIVDNFPYNAVHYDESSYTYQIPILAIPTGTCGVVAAEAKMVKYNSDGKLVKHETVWANGESNKTAKKLMIDYCSIVP